MKKIFFSLFILIVAQVFCYAQTSADVEKQAYEVLRNYEKAMSKGDLAKMVDLVDPKSKFYKEGFLDSFQQLFKTYPAVRIYHFDKDSVYVSAFTVEITQNTLFIAYNKTITNMSEYKEIYTLSKIGGSFKITGWVKDTNKDAEDIDKGNGYLLNGETTKAISFFKEAISHNSNNSVAYARLGTVYAKQNKWPQAAESLQKAVDLRSDASLYRFLLAQVHLMQNNADKALEEMTMALRQDDDLHMIGSEEKE